MTIAELLKQPMPIRHNGHIINVWNDQWFIKINLILANGSTNSGDYACDRPASMKDLVDDLKLFTGLDVSIGEA